MPAIYTEDIPEESKGKSKEQPHLADFDEEKVDDTEKTDGIILINEENDPFEDIVNNRSPIGQKTQLELKGLYSETFAKINTKIDSESINQVKHVRDKILETIFSIIEKTHRKSQLKIIGNYEKYHGLNVALLSAMLAKKMNMTEKKNASMNEKRH